MKVRGIDENGDWTFGRGAGDYLRENQAVAQDIQTALLSFLGDCFWDLGAGVDWLNLLGAGSPVRLKLAISSVILNRPNVTRLNQLDVTVDPQTRKVLLQYSADTVFSTLTTGFETTIGG